MTLPQHTLVPFKFRTKCLRKRWHVWILRWLRKPWRMSKAKLWAQVKQKVFWLWGRSVCEVTVLPGWRKPNILDVITTLLWRTASSTFGLKVTMGCLVLKYLSPGDSRLSIQKCPILNPTRSKAWPYDWSSRVSEFITFVLHWDRADAECWAQGQSVSNEHAMGAHQFISSLH